MDFNTHLALIKKDILDSLNSNKEDLILGIATIAIKTSKLLRTDCFEFWIRQLHSTPWRDIPTTTYAIEKEKIIWETVNPDQKSIMNALSQTLENILTYWEEDDLCEMSGQFYYYKEMTTNEVFCESEFGEIRNFPGKLEILEIGIATLSDLRKVGIISKKGKVWDDVFALG